MSQKYKNFAKGCGLDCNTALPPDVKRVGYLRKLKKMKRRFFVLYVESEAKDARLEYYSSEKKWRSGNEPRRSIELKTCLNISRKLHSKQKNVIDLYTQDDCFSVVAETPEELELWLEDMLEVQRTYAFSDENKSRPIFEHLWQVEIDKHDLECSQSLTGPYRVALSSKALTLIKMSPSSDYMYLEFPLMSIRRCGHSKDHFFIELGRSAVTGAGEIYMATEGTIVAQNMHETVLSAMKSSKVREDGNPLPRPRSASTSENSNPVTTRRPVGVVAPQTLSSISTNTLSNSRERCDSLPTRPKTLSENPHACVFSVLSSPHSSTGIACRRLSSRPHSMYEWPSFNSPSTRITSPFSLSSSGGYASSSEEVDSIRQSSSFYSQTKSTDGSLCSDHPITEVPDEYLMMSPSEETTKPESAGYMVMKQTENVSSNSLTYIDMKSTKSKLDSRICLTKKPNSYMPMAPGGVTDDTPVVMQDGYIDMSPSSKSYLKNFNDINSLDRNKSKLPADQNVKAEQNEQFILEKVPSLLKISDDERKIESLKDKNFVSNTSEKNINQTLSSHSVTDNRLKNNDIPFQQTFFKENENLTVKPPIPERTYKNDSKNAVCPPIPMRRNEPRSNANFQHKSENFNCKLKHNQNELNKIVSEDQDLSQCIQVEENSVFEDLEVFPKSNIQDNLACVNKVSPSDQNTNFSCLIHNERSVNNMLPCASMCSAHQIPFKQGTSCNQIEQNQNQSVLKHTDSANKFKCLENIPSTQTNSKIFTTNQNCKMPHSSHFFSKPENHNILPVKNEPIVHSCGDYVNLEFKTSGSSNLPQTTTSTLSMKATHLIPNPPLDVNYTNIQFGKPFCPTPNPIPASCDTSTFISSLKSEKSLKCEQSSILPLNNNSIFPVPEDVRGSKMHHSNPSADVCVALPGKIRNIPNTLPAFRKQMSAPAAPPSLRPELPSPGRKSSCPVTASASMIKPPLPTTTVAPMRPVLYHLQGSTTGHLRVSISRSPDHSSVSSISSASDEISSNHSSPKILNTSQNFGISKCNSVSDSHYENVVIPQRPTTSRPSSVSSEKELNYASLDLAPSVRDEVPRSPTVQKPTNVENVETLLYAEIDFTKSEGLKNTSGTVREGRL